MKYWLILACLCMVGCNSENSNIVEDADAAAMQEYEAALAEADAMMAADEDAEE